VVTSTLVLEGDGKVGDYVGGYTDWLRQCKSVAVPAAKTAAPAARPVTGKTTAPGKTNKRSYKDQRELDSLPVRIEALEAEQAALQAAINVDGFYLQEGDAVAVTLARLESVGKELEACYEHWATLEAGG
jgi:ATP-binding cassette subfamily F protein uup